MTENQAIDLFSALAHPHRLAVFRRLVCVLPDGCSAGELSDALRVPPSSLSFHLSQLEKCALVKGARTGRQIIYSAHTDALEQLITYILSDCCDGRLNLLMGDVLERGSNGQAAA